MITTYSHLKNIPVTVIFPEQNNIGKQLLRIVIVDYNDESMLFYSGKKITFTDSNLTAPITGDFAISINDEHYILLDAPLTFEILANTNITYHTTFTVDNDNEAITTGDLLSKYNKQTENFIFEGVELYGTFGLLSPKDYSKLKSLSKFELYDLGLTFAVTESYQFLGAVKVEYSQGLFKHNFGIVGNIANVEWLLTVVEGDETNFSLITNKLINSVKCDYVIKLTSVTHTDTSKYIVIELMLSGLGDITGLTPEHNILHQTLDRLKILSSQSEITTIDFIYSTISVEPTNYGESVTDLKFNRFISGYNKIEPILNLTKNLIIPDNQDLDLLINVGNYYGAEYQIVNITHKPTGLVKGFRIEIKSIINSNTNFVISQTLYSLDADNKPLIFTRLITTTTIGEWVNIDSHKVLGSNITTDENHRLVTDEQINDWDKIKTSAWKNPVATIADLPTTYPTAVLGWTTYVVAENCNYVFNGIIWSVQNLDGVQLLIEKTKYELDVLINNNQLQPGSTYKITGVHPTLYNDGTSVHTKIETLTGTFEGGINYPDGAYDDIAVITENGNSMKIGVNVAAGIITTIEVQNPGYDFQVDDTITIDNIYFGSVGEGFIYTIVEADIINIPKGTTIYLKALTSNTLESSGYGHFWNPKYDRTKEDYGVWNDKSTWITSSIVGTFETNENVISNDGATGKLIAGILGNSFIATSSGWETATSITGTVSGATANITSINLASYSIGDKVFWGGYVWINNEGYLGNYVDDFILDDEWTKITFNTNDYELVLDIIEYDIVNDWIGRRIETKYNNDVTYTFNDNNWFGYDFTGINCFMFGNGLDTNLLSGLGINIIKNSIFNCINFRGESIYGNTFTNNSYFLDNNCYEYSNIEYNKLDNESVMSGNILNGGSIRWNNLETYGYFDNNYITNGSINENVLFEANIVNNTIDSSSRISYNILNNSSIRGQILLQNNHVNENNLRYSTIAYNIFKNSNECSISYNNLFQSSIGHQDNNKNELTSGNIQNNNLEYSEIHENVLYNTTLNYNKLYKSKIKTGITNTITEKTLTLLEISNSDLTDNFLSTDLMFDITIEKQVYKRPDGKSRIRWFNNHDVLVISEFSPIIDSVYAFGNINININYTSVPEIGEQATIVAPSNGNWFGFDIRYARLRLKINGVLLPDLVPIPVASFYGYAFVLTREYLVLPTGTTLQLYDPEENRQSEIFTL